MPPRASRRGALVLVALLALLALSGCGGSSAPPTLHVLPAKPAVVRAPKGFPAPPPGAVVLAREDASDDLALAVVPGRPLTLTASVVGPEAKGRRGLSLSFAASGQVAEARPCGAGCYRAQLMIAWPARLVVRVLGHGSLAALSLRWPLTLSRPHPALALLKRLETRWAALKSLSFRERLASGPRARLDSSWRAEAPASFSYRSSDGARAVVIGRWRWDEVGGGRWRRSPQYPVLPQPTPPWRYAEDVNLVASGKTLELTFFDPTIPAWFDVRVSKRLLPRATVMTAPAHFMEDDYSAVDTPRQIRPPR